MKYLIDTDIGDDIDDAAALLAAMNHGLDIVGITTTFRNTRQRARMTKKLLRRFGKDYEKVPVYAGFPHSQPGNIGADEDLCQYTEDLESPEYAPDATDPDAAADFIINACRRWGKELTVIALGPFCNMAKVIEKDPAALNLAAKVTIMGGAYYKQYADWNVMCDVSAADVMFRNLSNLECMGADVTHRLTVPKELSDFLEFGDHSNPALQYVSQMYGLWHTMNPTIQLLPHDVLVVYYAMDPTVCTMERIRAAVLTEGYARGLTLNVDAYGKAQSNAGAYAGFDFGHTILAARDVDLPKFHTLFTADLTNL